jgi:hypothetical protein
LEKLAEQLTASTRRPPSSRHRNFGLGTEQKPIDLNGQFARRARGFAGQEEDIADCVEVRLLFLNNSF